MNTVPGRTCTVSLMRPTKPSPSQISFVTLIEALPQLAWLAAPDGSPAYFNSPWLEYTGLTRENCLVGGWRAAIHPEEQERLVHLPPQIADGNQAGILEFRLRGRDGAYRWMRGNIRPLRDEQDNIAQWIGTCTDIHDLKQAEEERDRFFMLSLDMLGIVGPDGNFKRVNPAFMQTMGFTEAELMSRPFRERVHPEDWDRTHEAAAKLAQGVPLTDLVNRYCTRDGQWRWLEWRSVCAPESGVIYATARDITQRKENEARFQFQTALLEAQIEASLDGILIVSEAGKILSYNRNLLKMWNLSRETVEQADDDSVFKEISQQIVTETDFLQQATNLRRQQTAGNHEELALRDGRMMDCYSAPIVGDDDTYHGRVWYFRDVTERKQAEAQLQAANAQLSAQAVTDALTGLNNRRALDAGLHREFQRAVENNRFLSLILLDIDHFKSFNDSLGHPAGDRLIRDMGRLLREEANGADLIARYGGEEFALLLVNADEAQAVALAERLRQRIAATNWEQRTVTASFGVATTTTHIASAEELLADADAALYHSKNQGRNRVTHHARLSPAL